MAKKPKPVSRRKRTGLPAPESVVEERVYVSPSTRAFRILKTTETDAYDPPRSGRKRRK